MRYYTITGLSTIMSEQLYTFLTTQAPQFHHAGKLFVPNIDWVRRKNPAGETTREWSLNFLPMNVLRKEDLFACESLTIHIDKQYRERLQGKMLDVKNRRLRVRDIGQNRMNAGV